MVNRLTSIFFPFFTLRNRIPPRVIDVAAERAEGHQAPGHREGEPYCRAALAGQHPFAARPGRARGTMPFLISADAIPGAVVTAVVPPCRRTPAAACAPAPRDVAADAAVTAGPVSTPVIATTAARYLNPPHVCSSPARHRAALFRFCLRVLSRYKHDLPEENVKYLSRGLYSVPVNSPADRPLLRIGELSRRLGVSDHVLRAWESRYGLLQPVRSPGGFRLYSEADEARIRRMQAYLADGLSAAEAARAALGGGTSHAPAGSPVRPSAASAGSEPLAALRQALDAFDEPAAQAVLDRLMTELSLPAVLRDVVLPYLADLGERWRRGTASIAMEHFASNLIRGRLAGLARGWGSGHGPQALLACPPGELHDMALMVFGIVLEPQRMADRLPGGQHPGRGTGARRRHLATRPGRPRRHRPGEPRAAAI